MYGPTKFPDALRSSAVARWSHRDPVESGNPFSQNDFRHQAWDAAPDHALEALARVDPVLEEAEKAGPHPDSYPVRLVALAVARFDVWAERGLSIVRDSAARQDYEQWLQTYSEHWVHYVADTCPGVAVGDDLLARLTTHAEFWVSEARRAVSRFG